MPEPADSLRWAVAKLIDASEKRQKAAIAGR
jgi:hypothetical protein